MTYVQLTIKNVAVNVHKVSSYVRIKSLRHLPYHMVLVVNNNEEDGNGPLILSVPCGVCAARWEVCEEGRAHILSFFLMTVKEKKMQ